MDQNTDLGTIGRAVWTVLHLFKSLQDTCSEENISDELKVFLTELEDEAARFKIWAGSVGAHQSGAVSLDHRLKEAPHLHEQVIYLLTDLSETLQEASQFRKHEVPQRVGQQDGSAFEQEVAFSANNGASSSHGSLTDSDEDYALLETGPPTLLADTGEAINCLLRLSVAIANPVPHERLRTHGFSSSDDLSLSEAHDIRYVLHKHPGISESLAGVLGKLITRRCQFFQYREAHRIKLADRNDNNPGHGNFHPEAAGQDIAVSDLQGDLNSMPYSGSPGFLVDEDDQSDSGLSQISDPTNVGLEVENVQEDPWPRLKIPPMPDLAHRGLFECPYCYRMVSASTRIAWKLVFLVL